MQGVRPDLSDKLVGLQFGKERETRKERKHGKKQGKKHGKKQNK